MMTSCTRFTRFARVALAMSLAMLCAGRAAAQEATLTGIVTDSTGAVLPGVTVTALHPASGNSFVAVTDEHGAFRVPVRTGAFTIQAELQGFATAQHALELLVGQTAVVNMQMVPATLEEAVTVNGQAPLVDTTSSALGSNVDPMQMRELPLNGRNFVDLTMLAAGSRQNASTDELGGLGTFQMNVDGLRVTQNQTGGFGQPKYSRDAIAEFEFVSNRFDATQGGSSGTMVNAITKSGTNTMSGTFSSYFRDDKFMAADFVQHRVLPYQDQQYSTTLGGPIRKDRIHFFANYEYEHEPQTFTHSSPYPSFNMDLSGARTEHKGGGRVDGQLSPSTHLTVRGNKSLVNFPYDSRYTGGSIAPPLVGHYDEPPQHRPERRSHAGAELAAAQRNPRRLRGLLLDPGSVVAWPDHPYPGLTYGTPIINMRSYTIGQAHNFSHEDERQSTYSVRDNLTWSVRKGGPSRHENGRGRLLPEEPGLPVHPLHGHL